MRDCSQSTLRQGKALSWSCSARYIFSNATFGDSPVAWQGEVFFRAIQSTFLGNDRPEKCISGTFFNELNAERDMFRASEANKEEWTEIFLTSNKITVLLRLKTTELDFSRLNDLRFSFMTPLSFVRRSFQLCK